MNTKHSPLPWARGVHQRETLFDGEDQAVVHCRVASLTRATCEANAELVERAVNCHEALVEACRDLLACPSLRLDNLEDRDDVVAIDEALAALALAEGKS